LWEILDHLASVQTTILVEGSGDGAALTPPSPAAAGEGDIALIPPPSQAKGKVSSAAAEVGATAPPARINWNDLVGTPGDLEFEAVPFDHPLWVLYSSGTTGLPKAIVHGHGGILIDHLRCLSLQTGLDEDDRFFWFTSTGWMMWNKLVSGLLLGCTIVLYDGSPNFPDLDVLWQLVQDTGITCFGTSAPYLLACRKAGLEPGRDF